MKITSVEKVETWIVETDEEPWNVYRTDGKGTWELLMNNSWEEYYDEGGILEKLFFDRF